MISQDRNSKDGTVQGAMKKIPKRLGINGKVKIVVGKGIEFSQTEKRETNPVQKDQTTDPERLFFTQDDDSPQRHLDKRGGPLSRVLSPTPKFFGVGG